MFTHEGKEGPSVNPWVDIEPNALHQTGGDWYQLLLSASLGFKAVHGANTSPTCEVLCKASKSQIDLDTYGILSWDPTVKLYAELGSDLSDEIYNHHTYRGSITASGSVLAYETGLWEPSMRKRARSTSLLAAGLNVHGCAKADAIEIVSKVAGEKIDEEAVDSAIIPASHLKRELVLVSKANHRVFSRGSLQSGLTWYDAKLSGDTLYRNVAFDWGRVTALARYIGEANVQNCHLFRKIAHNTGIAYVIVRNAWAYVADVDYHLTTDMFQNVMEMDLEILGIPSLKGAFTGHEQDVMLALARRSEGDVQVPESDAFKAYISVLKDAKKRKRTYERTKVAPMSEAREVFVTEHSVTPNTVLDLLEGSRVARSSYLMALASRRACDRAFDELMTRVESCDLKNEADQALVDKASRIIYNKHIWVMAKAIAENTLMEGEEGDSQARDKAVRTLGLRISNMRADIVGYPTHIETPVNLTTSQLVNAREKTIRNAKESQKGMSKVTFTQRTLMDSQLKETVEAVSKIHTNAPFTLSKLQTSVASTYEQWFQLAMDSEHQEVKLGGCVYAYVAAALRKLTEAMCLQKDNGYIEGTKPRRSYVYLATVRLSTYFGFIPPALDRVAYTGAVQLTRELDLKGTLPYSLAPIVEEVTEILDEVVGDLMVGKLWEPDPETYDDMYMKNAPAQSPQYDTSMMERQQYVTIIEAFMKESEAERVPLYKNDYSACLNTYASEALANKYARAMGYPDLRAAYDVLGIDAYNVEGSQFVMDACAKIALGGGASTSTQVEEDEGYIDLI